MNSPNTSCDVFHTAILGTDEPDIASVPCFLVESYPSSSELEYARQYTAVMDVALSSGLRDGYNGENPVSIQLGTGEVFIIVFVERDRKQWGRHFLRAYLLRQF